MSAPPAVRRHVAQPAHFRPLEGDCPAGLLAYEWRGLGCFLLLLMLVALPVALIGLVAPGGMAHWLELLMRPFAIAVLCLCSVLYILVRTRLARA